MNIQEIQQIVKKLQEASVAYYETGSPILSDSEYDNLLETLRSLDPGNTYFSNVGAIPGKDRVKLPIPMPSLRKVKPDSWDSWGKNSGKSSSGYVVSEKLDGISAIWSPVRRVLYLRGNGIEGQDVSHLVKFEIQGLYDCPYDVWIRGELIVPKEVVANARNWVNGVIHQSNPNNADVQKIQFLGYQVYGEAVKGLSRKAQFLWLQKYHYPVPWWSYVEKLDAKTLETLFQMRRQQSEYENDGIVVGIEKVPDGLDAGAADPKDIVAFKVPCDDQRSETSVTSVEWSLSLGGKWIPRVIFNTVSIGNAKISCCTGHNAKYIEANGIGPGARIVIRRSGDVIPYLEHVVSQAEGGPQMPSPGSWTYDGNGVHALYTGVTDTPETIGKQILHSLTVFGFKGLGEKNVQKLVQANVKSIYDILQSSMAFLQGMIGEANGMKLYNGLRTCLQEASPEQWILAWHGWPNGFGVVTCRKILSIERDVRKWNCAMSPYLSNLKDYYTWVDSILPLCGKTMSLPVPTVTATAAPKKADPTKGGVVFTGFRDADLEAKFTEAGWEIQDSIKKTTKALVVADLAKKSSKVLAAEKAGIPIYLRTMTQSLF